MPALGTAGGFGGEKDDKFVFYTFTSIYISIQQFIVMILPVERSTVFRKPEVKFNPEEYTMEQVFYPGKDGTKVPMFIVYKKGTQKNGKNPTILYGYGGFNISSNPIFFINKNCMAGAGRNFCIANLRGGSEYGENGMKQVCD